MRHKQHHQLAVQSAALSETQCEPSACSNALQTIIADAKHAFVEHVEEEVKEKKKDRDTYEVGGVTSSTLCAIHSSHACPAFPL